MATDPKGNEEPGLVAGALGIIFIAIILYGGYKVVSAIVERWSPTPVISLMAYFDPPQDPKGHLKITGEVRQLGEPANGNIRLIASKHDASFEQSTYVNLTNGGFEVPDNPAFLSLRPEDQIHITVEFSYSKIFAPATKELYLNANPTTITSGVVLWIALGILFVVLIVFFYAFTGTKTPLKNRIAIIFSYCIIGLFLAIPLLAPVLLLRAYPNARHAMIGQPAGLVVTRVPKDGGMIQWALNIGGYSTPAKAGPQPSPMPTPSPTVSPSPGPTVSPSPRSTGLAQPSPSPSPQPTSTIQTTPTGPSPKPTGNAANAGAASSPSPTVTPEASLKRDDSPDVVDVEGGLVIPLYVIILSVIGGAINMTRKVPRLQREGEYSEVGFSISGLPLLGRVMRWFKKKPIKNPEEQTQSDPKRSDAPSPTAPPEAPAAAASDNEASISNQTTESMSAEAIAEELKKLVAEQTERRRKTQPTMKRIRELVDQLQKLFAAKKDDESPVLGCDSYEDWLPGQPALKELLGTPWRVELLSQYMYLISAPFLAIVAYYMLELLGFTKQPIIVLISFSVGLISEKILTWLLGLASGYLRTDASSQSAAKH